MAQAPRRRNQQTNPIRSTESSTTTGGGNPAARNHQASAHSKEFGDFTTCTRCRGLGGMDGGCPKCGGTGFMK